MKSSVVDKQTELYEKIADAPRVFASAGFQEAFARLEFVVAADHSLAIVTGDRGCGRSTLLRVFARDARRRGDAVCRLGLWGADERSWWWNLAIGLGTNPPSSEDSFLLQYRVRDHLQQQRLLGRRTLLLLDDADQAAAAVRNALLRLIKTPEQPLSVILAAETEGIMRLGTTLLQLGQLHIRLEAWTVTDIAAYLEQTPTPQDGCSAEFDDSAVARLAELTCGLPREITQLVEWVRLAAATERCPQIDRLMVDEVFHQLCSAADSQPACTGAS